MNARKIRFGKKGLFVDNWAEISFLAFPVIGFVLGKLIIDSMFAFLLVGAAGIVSARLYYVKKDDNPWTFQAVSIAFMAGYLLGHRIGNGLALLMVFSATWALSYFLHRRVEFLA